MPTTTAPVSKSPILSIGHAGPFGRATRAAPLVRILPAHEIALEGLYYGIDVPFGPVVIPEQFLDAWPAGGTVEIARVAFIEKFAMLFAYIFLVFLTVFDLHRIPLSDHRPPPSTGLTNRLSAI
jgi:hypothetical protein